MPEREGSGPGCRPAPGGGGPGPSHSSTYWPAGYWPSGSFSCTGRSTTYQSPRLGGADDARCRGRRGGDPRVDCGEAASPALTLMDVIELMGVPVRALCLGQMARAPSAWSPSAPTAPPCPAPASPSASPSTQLEAHVRNVAQWAELRPPSGDRFCARVAAASGRPPAAVEADMERGRFFGAAEAVDYGILDEVCRPDAAVARLPGIGAAAHGIPAAALTTGGRRTRRSCVPTMRRWPRPGPASRRSPPASGTTG